MYVDLWERDPGGILRRPKGKRSPQHRPQQRIRGQRRSGILQITIRQIIHNTQKQQYLRQAKRHPRKHHPDPMQCGIRGPCEPEECDGHEECADEGWWETGFGPDGLAVGMFTHLGEVVSVCYGG